MQLLEATARAVQLLLEWGDSSLAIKESLSNLLECRLPATIQCLSHPSPHVCALSMSVLRDILVIGSIKSSFKQEDIKANKCSSYLYSNVGVINWHEDIEKCLALEAHTKLAIGMPMVFLDDAAKGLDCTIPI